MCLIVGEDRAVLHQVVLARLGVVQGIRTDVARHPDVLDVLEREEVRDLVRQHCAIASENMSG